MSENGRSELTFQTVDFVVWSFILAASVGIGIYYACSGGRQQSTEEFLVGNRQMNPIPVAMSLAVSFISAVMFLGMTSESYSNGVMIWLQTVAITIASIIISVSFLPIFHRLNLTSANEYLERRFNRACRLLGSTILILNMFVYMGVVLYAPSLALNQETSPPVSPRPHHNPDLKSFFLVVLLVPILTIAFEQKTEFLELLPIVFVQYNFVITIFLLLLHRFLLTFLLIAIIIFLTKMQQHICRNPFARQFLVPLTLLRSLPRLDLGGLKAVIWTDVFQMCIMVSGLLAVIIKGSIDLGGFSNVLRIVGEGNRLNLFELVLMSTDVTVRHTFWGLTIGASFMFLSIFGINQAQVQRYLSCSTVKTARIALALGTAIMLFIVSCAVTAGLVMYAYYADCDPISSGAVAKKDQMMPYFTLDLFHRYPGLPGLFLSAVFSASLSTISSGLNAVAAVTTEDVIKPCWPGLSDKRYTQLSKLMGGVLCSTVLSFFSMFGGPTLGLFSAGMFFPWTNSKGAFCGTLIGLFFSFWVGIGAQVYPPSYPAPSFSTSGCTLYNDTSNLYNSTGYGPHSPDDGVSTVTELATGGATTLDILMTSEPMVDERYKFVIQMN
ncbi:sodium-coupled monocarboxylate transporter 1-like [Strongylocentrotus purpuratus]|uniref:Sodium-coupled monocarboxylate transporter 1 n=1 Tax=Strongylocentrotus purpuratus TaxID=7668 RepID=A0A7M7NPW4_STRPU|nr:sodium-coupled monocarboxylate transporter 1-like [Strongylocentrotus purpuratus]